MRTHVLALLAALLLLLGLGAGTAAAQAPTQAAGQAAGSQQSASSNANATQVAPSNRNVDVRIFSPGDSGAVSQTNAAGAAGVAGNANQTGQSATQAQPGAGTQAVGQGASNAQSAGATANGVQVKPSNDNVSVRIDSPGNDGPADQTNAAGALAAAGNANQTTQSADQSQTGGSSCCKGGGGTQAAGQSAQNDQSADASANAEQVKPSNKNVSVRIDSPGNGGSVNQTNAAAGGALAGDANETSQSAGQSSDGSGCKCGGGGTQVADQKAKSKQSADADANARQIHPSNNNTSVRIDSPGDDGPVEQTNLALAGALAGNANGTHQDATQSGGGGGVQAADQAAYNGQHAGAEANAVQLHPSNDNMAVRIGSPGSSGPVTQTNAALAGALAANLNETSQSADQAQGGSSCKCHGGGGVQSADQKAKSDQGADADGNAFQIKPSNSNTPVDIGGGHKGGYAGGSGGEDPTQTNAAAALGIGLNTNSTDQSATQSSGGGAQFADQSAYNDQYADGDANAVQFFPSNSNTPVSIGGSGAGGGGPVTQTNAALAAGIAANLNETTQSADQSQAGSSCKCYGGGGVQVAGQKAGSDQYADADGNAFQIEPSNSNTPVGYGGSGGDVTQTNLAAALGVALNGNSTDQSVTQSQGGSGLQAADQAAYNDQYADAEGNAVQYFPSNSNAPVGAGGGGGSVSQTNAALAAAIGANLNETTQSVDQSGDGGGVQAVGQKAAGEQGANAEGNAFQIKPSNSNTPVDLHGHKGGYGGGSGGGDVTQTNLAAALGIAANANSTDQSVTQQGGDTECGCGYGGVQAVGQQAYNDQYADAEGNAVQYFPSNSNAPVGAGGGGGSVYQTNAALAAAIGANLNETTQSVDQSGDGGGVQAVGQKAAGEQGADADGNAFQIKPSNSNTPVGSGGSGGDVTQTNLAVALAAALNANSTDQSVTQSQAGDGVQAVGQFAYSDQYADGDANAVQFFPSNGNTPVSIGGGHKGGYSDGSRGGDLTQTNLAAGLGLALNANSADQTVVQSQGGGCGCGYDAVQAVGQSAWNDQYADADANAFQFGADNSNTPVRVWSPGGSGSVSQANAALAFALAANLNATEQEVLQTQ